MRAMEAQWKDAEPRLKRNLIYYGLPLLLYSAIVIPLAIASRERINPDAVSYIRRALYISQGDFYHSLSGYWSPLISWCIAPLMKMGMDGLHAARLVTCIWGGLWLVAFGTFLSRFTAIHWLWKLCALLVMAIYIAEIAARQLTPDIILGACLFFYFSLITTPNLLRRPKIQFSSGLLAGFSYLAKSYALPFTLLHLPLTILLRSLFEKPQPKPVPLFLPLARGLVGILLIAIPFITILSWRYNRLTISTSGAHAHTDVGPPEIQAAIPNPFGRAEDPYITRHETKDEIAYPRWSPFQSRAYFKHQLNVAADHASSMVRNIFQFDRLYLSIPAAALALLILARLIPFQDQLWKILWLLLTILLYCSGMLWVFFTPRYLLPVWAPLFLTLGLIVALNIDPPSPSRIWQMIRPISAAVILFSFVLAAALNGSNTDGHIPAYRNIAAELKKHDIYGPLSSPDRQQGMFIAFFADEKFLGFPPDDSATIAAQKLLDEKPAALLIFKGKKVPKEMQAASRLASQICKSPQWKLAFDFHLLDKQTVEVYVPLTSKAPSDSK
ncbi:MAG TPA: hypothetical protein VGQ99_10065 [Tepidisphaeraceae bacterium]|jgi:hypothetical protein|nr:hypothetical protein [Tepidisphaeraceae bacterium]